MGLMVMAGDQIYHQAGQVSLINSLYFTSLSELGRLLRAHQIRTITAIWKSPKDGTSLPQTCPKGQAVVVGGDHRPKKLKD